MQTLDPDKMQTIRPHQLLLGVYDVMEILGIGRSTVLKLTYEGKLPSVKIYNRRLYRRSAIEAYVDALEIDNAPD